MQPDTAGPPPSPWAVSAGGFMTDYSTAVALDSTGASTITGCFSGTASFGSTTLTAKGGADVFVARLDKTGKFVWVVSAGGSSDDYSRALALDSTGTVTITGRFSGTASFGSTTLTAKGGADVFVARLDKTGKFLWAVSAGGTSNDFGRALAVDSTGAVTIAGYFLGTASLGSTTLTATGSADLFVARLDTTGKFVWAMSTGGTSKEIVRALAVDSTGASTITGYFQGTASFGSTTLTAKRDDDIFVARLDASGKVTWAVSAGGYSYDRALSVALDGTGDSIITGYFQGTASFGGTTLTSKGPQDLFVARLDKTGKFVWVASAGQALGRCIGEAVAVDSTGTSTITGSFAGPATFGSTKLTSNGQSDMFVARLDKTGKFVWAVSAGGTSSDSGFAVALDSTGASTVTGSFLYTVSFGSTSLTSKGNADIFVARLDKTGKF